MDRIAKRAFPLALFGVLSAALIIFAALAASCGGEDYVPDTTVTSTTTGITEGTSARDTAPDSGTPGPGDGPATTAGSSSGAPVTFSTEDGLTLSGNLYGAGNLGVVLSHMYPADQTSWAAVAEDLAREGYLVLTYDFRGYGESEGTKDIAKIDSDVSAAATYLRSAGASDIALVGASMGGTASLMAATTMQAMSSVRLAGVATLSAPVAFEGLSAVDAVPALVVPLLFIAAEGDGAAGQAQQLENLSGGKGDLQIVPGSDHGTDLFSGAQSDTVLQLLIDFLQQTLQVGNL